MTDPPRNIAPMALAFESALAVVALAAGWIVRQPPLQSVELSWDAAPRLAEAALWGAAATLPMLLSLWALDRWPIGPLADLHELVSRRVAPLFADATLPQLAAVSLAAGFGEEMLFRGVLQQALTDRIGGPWGVAVGLLVASAAFGLCHWLTPVYALLAGLTGLYLGALHLAAGQQLLAPIAAHALYDFFALAFLVRRIPDAPPPPTQIPD